MKYFLKFLYICLVLFIPLITHSDNKDEVIFLYPETNELWISPLRDTSSARPIFEHTHWIFELAVQSEGRYMVIVGEAEDHSFRDDAYLIDRGINAGARNLTARNLTKKRFDQIYHIDISHNGDIVFTNYPTGAFNPFKYGVYLIPYQQLKRSTPAAELLFESDLGNTYNVEWSPDGEHITFYDGDMGTIVYNVPKRKIILNNISLDGRHPTFSTDGKRLAYVNIIFGSKAQEINIMSLGPPIRHLKTIIPVSHSTFYDLKWMPNGKAILYSISDTDHKERHYVAPLNGTPHEEVLILGKRGYSIFDWTNSVNLSVEPKDKLATLWGKLKQ